MSHTSVQGILKNSDLLLDEAEIRSVVASVLRDKRLLEARIERQPSVYSAILLQVQDGESLLLSRLEPDAGNEALLRPDVKVALYFQMGGYALETILTCLQPPGEAGIVVSYPVLFRVHSKRQISRFSTPLDMTSFVEMVGQKGHVHGELQDINQEGLSFLGGKVQGEILVDEEVRLRLIPLGQGEAAMDLTGILRYAGLDQPKGLSKPQLRYSIQIVSILDPDAFHIFFSKIKTCSHSLFRASVMSAESYRLIAAI